MNVGIMVSKVRCLDAIEVSGYPNQTKYAEKIESKVSLTPRSNKISTNGSYLNAKEALKEAMSQYEKMPSDTTML